MVNQLNDEQVARLLVLCKEIADVRKELPPVPRGMNGDIEAAKALRSSLDKHEDSLTELAGLLRWLA